MKIRVLHAYTHILVDGDNKDKQLSVTDSSNNIIIFKIKMVKEDSIFLYISIDS
jgi:hypothetical protein